MYKATLKNDKISEIFSLVFPAECPMNYSEERKSVEHPSNKGVWIKVDSNEIELLTFEDVA